MKITDEDIVKTQPQPLASRSSFNNRPKNIQTPTEVMDVLPWPSGYGFAGGEIWWQRVLSHTDRERLDDLIGLALLDKQICDRLLVEHDLVLLATFGLSEQAQGWLRNIQASTLKELAQAIVDTTQFDYTKASSSEAA